MLLLNMLVDIEASGSTSIRRVSGVDFLHDMLLDIQGGAKLEQIRVAIGMSPDFDVMGGDGEVLRNCREFVCRAVGRSRGTENGASAQA